MNRDSQLRLLYVGAMLRETDEKHPLTNAAIMQRLADTYGIATHRTTVPADIALLAQAGMKICIAETKPKRYYLDDSARDFSLAELKMLVDAVCAAKFLAAEDSRVLVSKLKMLGSPTDAVALDRHMFPEGRVRQEIDKIRDCNEVINRAIHEGRKISFQYFRYDVRKEPRLKNDGAPYLFSPYALIWNGDYFYTIGFSEKHGGIGIFRVDRMARVPRILDASAAKQPEGFDVESYTNGMFRMYGGNRRDVELICDNSVMDSIVDQFGLQAKTYAYNMTSFRLEVNVAVSHVFFGWVFGFAGKVRIKAPEDVKAQYMEMVAKALETVTVYERT